MECNEARGFIDERVNGSQVLGVECLLDEHLKHCAACAAELRQLERVRGLLHEARQDLPHSSALDPIWRAVRPQPSSIKQSERNQIDMSHAAAFKRLSSRAAPHPLTTRRWKIIAAASLSAAALLVVSFAVGMQRHGHLMGRMDKGDAKAAPYASATKGRMEFKNVDAVPSNAPPKSGQMADVDVPQEVREKAERSDHFETHETIDEVVVRGVVPREQFYQDASKRDINSLAESKSAADPAQPPAPPPPPPATLPPPPGAPAPASVKGKEKAERKPSADSKADPAATAADEAKSRPKIIKTGELTLEVKNFAEGSRSIDQLVVRFGAFVADNRTSDLPGATKRGEIVIRVAPEKFEELFGALKKTGLVLHERAGGQDITAQYTDSEARVKNLQIAEERLQDLIKSKSFIDKIQSLLEVERELSRVRGEIESIQGQMRVWNNQLALSTIRVTLQEPSRAVPSGSLSVEVPVVSEAKKALDAALTAVGGQLLSGQASKRGDGTLMGTYSVQVKFGRFGELLAAIKGLGRAQDERIINQPFAGGIPDGAQDVPCEIALVLFERSIQLPSGSLNLEVQALGELLPKLDQALAASQAVIVNNQSQRDGNGATRANITIRVAAGQFAPAIETLAGLGRVTQRSIGGETGKILGGAAEVPCTLSLVVSERPIQLPSGSLNLEVQALGELMPKLEQTLAASQAVIVNNQSQRDGNGATRANLTIRVAAGQFAAAVDALAGLGRVTHRSTSGESGRIMGGAAEAPCTLSLVVSEQARQVPVGSMNVEVATFADAREQLQALIKEHAIHVLDSSSNQRSDGTWAGSFKLGIKADKMDAMVGLIEKLGRVKSRQLQGVGLGGLSKTDPNVVGEVALTLEEKLAFAPHEEGAFRGMWRDTFGGFLDSMGIIIRGLGVILPWATLLGLFVWVLYRFTGSRAASQVSSRQTGDADASPEPQESSTGPNQTGGE
jgi:hypothetical protein